jgi:hypothetical protein
MSTIVSALIAVLALSVIVAVIVAMQKQRIRRESRALDEMLFRKGGEVSDD